MKAKILLILPMLVPGVAFAGIPYRVQYDGSATTVTDSENDNTAFARVRRFYAGGAYNFSMWGNYTDDADVFADGKNVSSFEVVAGMRLYDIFRIEANYINNRAKWDVFSMQSDTVMLNAIFDARIDSLYRLFYQQRIVPYVGLGAGASFNSAKHVEINDKVSPAVAALAGVGFELGDRFAIDIGYRYFYMFTPHFDTISDMNPAAHQFRAGARINF